MDNKEAVLGEEDLVTVSYMAEELDLETVGDIIAIIEEKVNQTLFMLFLNYYNYFLEFRLIFFWLNIIFLVYSI